jgi:hypothetical protein
MNGQENKHVTTFRQTKLKPNETVQLHLEGWIGDVMGKGDKTQRNGQFVLTNERACFYRKGMLGELLETIPLPKITSVETFSRLGYRVLTLHTSHDELAFKTFEQKHLFDQVYSRLEELRHNTVSASEPTKTAEMGESALDQLKKLGELREAGILTEDEFVSKKANLLARL